MGYVVCRMSYVVWGMGYVVCRMVYGVCCILYGVNCCSSVEDARVAFDALIGTVLVQCE
jgi:hypothetical protein